MICYLWLVLEVDGVSITLLENSGVEVVLVLDVQVPAADVGVGHVVAAQLGRLDVPDVLLAAGVLVADLHSRGRDAVNPLKNNRMLVLVCFNIHLNV